MLEVQVSVCPRRDWFVCVLHRRPVKEEVDGVVWEQTFGASADFYGAAEVKPVCLCDDARRKRARRESRELNRTRGLRTVETEGKRREPTPTAVCSAE